MSSPPRPLSPHLQVYRLPLTGLISITHRITGVLLSLCLLLLLALLMVLARGEEAYLAMQQFMQWWLCRLVYWGVVFSLFFHLVHGVRHLIWDIGKGFAKANLTVLALLELGCAAALTVMTLLV